MIYGCGSNVIVMVVTAGLDGNSSNCGDHLYGHHVPDVVLVVLLS